MTSASPNGNDLTSASLHQRLRDDPVIVLGMHHSGTSILAEILHRSGVFMQSNMHHHESKFFALEINDRLIMGNGANWARNPIMPVDEVMSKLPEVQHRIEKKGYRKYLEAGYDGHSRWGFKDPRTCVILPLYLKVFPNAQLLHIVRNEQDVAISLAASDKKGLGILSDLEFWKELQRQYVGRVREYGVRHKHYLEFDYETFCLQPVETMQRVFRCLNVELNDEVREFLLKNIYTHRINLSSQQRN